GIKKRAIADLVRAAPKDFSGRTQRRAVSTTALCGTFGGRNAIAPGGRPRVGDPEQNRNVLVTVQAVGDEKRDDDYVWRAREHVPIGHQRKFLHVNVKHVRVTPKPPDFFSLTLRRDRAVLV